MNLVFSERAWEDYLFGKELIKKYLNVSIP